MPNLTTNITDMIIKLRFAYDEADNKTIDHIKQDFQNVLDFSTITEKQKTLFEVEFNLLVWTREKKYSRENLLEAKRRLEVSALSSSTPSSIFSPSSVVFSPSSVSSSNALRWEKMKEASNNVINSLSQLNSGKASKEEIKRINLIKKVDAILEKIDEENIKEHQDIFEQVKMAFNNKAFLDFRAFLRSLILFYQVNKTRDDYAKELLLKIQQLTDDELKLLYKRMYSQEMISLINVALTQGHVIHFNDNDFEDIACQDAISIWPANQGRMKQMLLNFSEKGQLKKTDLDADAEAYFLGGANQIGTMLRFICVDVKNEMSKRSNRDSNFSDETSFQVDTAELFFDHWPCDDNGNRKPIKISALEKQLIAEAAVGLITEDNPLSKPERDTGVDQSLLLDQHFGDMMKALGGFFNPNLFFDALYSLNHRAPKYIEQQINELDDEDLYALYKNLQGEDLNMLMALLQRIKEGSTEQLKEISDWLLVKNPSLVNSELRVVAEKLYDSADCFMQMVMWRVQKIETEKESTTYVELNQIANDNGIKDYAYNNLELKESKMLTYKNSACIKHILERFCAASPEHEFKYTWFDRFYLFLYPSQKMQPAVNLPVDKYQSYRDSFVCISDLYNPYDANNNEDEKTAYMSEPHDPYKANNSEDERSWENNPMLTIRLTE